MNAYQQRRAAAARGDAGNGPKLTDDECSELIYLFRVVRAGNGTPDEIKRVRELLKKHKESK